MFLSQPIEILSFFFVRYVEKENERPQHEEYPNEENIILLEKIAFSVP